jgi:hypothetical protein
MSKATLIATLIAFVSAFFPPAKAQAPLKTKPSAKSDQPTYIITAHTVVRDESTDSQLDNYVIVYGTEVLKVQYAESQISTVKPGASLLEQVAPGKNLHRHTRYGRWPQEPDVSQVPQVGVPIRACEMDTKYPDSYGHPVIAIQSVSAPCMSRDGDTLHYVVAPNGGIKMWEYVNFDIVEATNNVGVVAAQSAPPRKDIPAIAKAANGAIVSIVMSDKDGHAIAQGSGFLISNDGVTLTNYHVIAEGSSAVVKFPDGAFYVVDGVLASDKARDIAVIKAHGQNFRPLPLGNSDRVQVGEDVVAIGNPLSLESTVSNGIVSGIRAVEENGGKYLQITAPISPGSSGGPLFNMAGEVIGITTMYLKGGENLNFAIPINDAKRLLLAESTQIQALPNEPEPVQAGTHAGAAPSPVASPPVQPPVEHAATAEQCRADMLAWGSEDQSGAFNKISYNEIQARAQEMFGCSTRVEVTDGGPRVGDKLPLMDALAYLSVKIFYNAVEALRLRDYIVRHHEVSQFRSEDAARLGSVASAQNALVEHAATRKQCRADMQAWASEDQSATFNKISYDEIQARAQEMDGCLAQAKAGIDDRRIGDRLPLEEARAYETLDSFYSFAMAVLLHDYILHHGEDSHFMSEDAAGLR